MDLKACIRTVPDYPKKGIMFRDITTLLKNGQAYKEMLDQLAARYRHHKVDIVAGVESRGFVTAAVLAEKLGAGFVPIRKPGKLPAETISEEYELEYGHNRVEIHKDAIQKGQRVLLCDDLLATGGTALAACHLIRRLGGEVIECCFIVDLPDLGGKEKLEANGYKVFKLINFEGD